MKSNKTLNPIITVIGLGYVGLPLAVTLATRFRVIGYDKEPKRISELKTAFDHTGEVSTKELSNSSITFVNELDPSSLSDFFVIAVPTPIDHQKHPDLSALEMASTAVGKVLKEGSLVVYESTVYPGVTEDICGPILEAVSGLKCGQDFYLGYSPERVNPGDRDHSIEKVIKVVAAQNDEIASFMSHVYGSVIPAGTFIARDIRTAEAAKVIENSQRDVNIAFINEVTMIFHRLGLDTESVLQAARTKWNFLDFRPGMVGGHCIGIDPYYLAYAAGKVDLDPDIILAGRRINDDMSKYIAEEVCSLIAPNSNILVLGLSFKENVPDLRNSQVIHMVRHILSKGHIVEIFDPLVAPEYVWENYGYIIQPVLPANVRFDAIIGAVAHNVFREITTEKLTSLIKEGGLLADLKGIWPEFPVDSDTQVWRL